MFIRSDGLSHIINQSIKNTVAEHLRLFMAILGYHIQLIMVLITIKVFHLRFSIQQ